MPKPLPSAKTTGALAGRSVVLLAQVAAAEWAGPVYLVATYAGRYALVTTIPGRAGLTRGEVYSFKTLEALKTAGLATYSDPMVAPVYDGRTAADSGRAWKYRLTETGRHRAQLEAMTHG